MQPPMQQSLFEKSAPLKLDEIPQDWVIFSFKIAIPPKSQERPRDRIVDTKSGQRYIQKYKSRKQSVYEMVLAVFISQNWKTRPLVGPIWIKIAVYMEIPKSKTRKFQLRAERGEIQPLTTPDVSNIQKQFEDVANKILFADDRQIVTAQISKHYGSPARWEITIGYRAEMQDFHTNGGI